MILNTGPVVKAWPDGRVQVSLGTGTIPLARRVEAVLRDEFSMKVLPEAQYQRQSQEAHIGFGIMGNAASRKQTGQVFPSRGQPPGTL